MKYPIINQYQSSLFLKHEANINDYLLGLIGKILRQ